MLLLPAGTLSRAMQQMKKRMDARQARRNLGEKN